MHFFISKILFFSFFFFWRIRDETILLLEDNKWLGIRYFYCIWLLYKVTYYLNYFKLNKSVYVSKVLKLLMYSNGVVSNLFNEK